MAAVKSGVRMLCTILYLFLMIQSLNPRNTAELWKSTSGLYDGSALSIPSIKSSHPINKVRYHETSSLSSRMTVAVGVHLLKQAGFVLLFLSMAGDIELNPGPVSSLHGIKARGLFIAHLNVRSLLGKLDELKFLIKSNSKSFDVLTLSETWLNTSISDAEIQISGYSY